MAFSPDGTLLASGSGFVDWTVRLWDVATGEVVRTLERHTGNVSSVAFSPDGRLLASGSSDDTVRLWGIAE
jgi:WD40 repeat protein